MDVMKQETAKYETIATSKKICILTMAFFMVSTVLLLYQKATDEGVFFDIIKKFQTDEKKTFDISHNTNSKTFKYVLSYTLFGKNSWQSFGQNVKNVAEEASKSLLYYNWTVRLYHENYPRELQENLTLKYRNLEFVDVRKLAVLNFTLLNASITNISSINGRTWRFLPISDLTVDVTCSRDLDSPLLKREEEAVKYWLHSNEIMHTMRDHPMHSLSVLAGTWCFRNSKDRFKGQKILKLLFDKAERRQLPREASKFNDQQVLVRYMWPLVRSDVMQHDSYSCKLHPGSIPFPEKRNERSFIGCKRVCTHVRDLVKCPVECRPKNHQDWDFC